MTGRRVRVWDPVVRVGHWTLVAGFAIAYLTEDDLLSLHVLAGYVVGAVVAVRIAWGFVGPRHARFGDFVRPPRAVLGYLRALLALRAPRYLGHSPAGGAMVLALLAALGFTVWSGLETYAREEGAGPLAATQPGVSERAAAGLVRAARADGREGDDEDEEREGRRGGWWKEAHEAAASLTLALVIVHVGGVLLASLAHGENLVRAMIDGYKDESLD